ncbi:MAG: putative DNA binding domain-containing protein [Bryobacterales bacterium]|nr:putative DNA binding domain-containing protein [Bryobacterales bacterium]
MPMSRYDVVRLLDELDREPADALEDQRLDFKEWDARSDHQSVRLAVSAAVCMANGGGGTVVFGVRDKVVGRGHAVVGVPHHVSVNRLMLGVYDGTDPRLTPVFEEVSVPEGTRRLILMHVHPGMPPYTDTAGRGTVRIGKDCKPLTGTVRRRLLDQFGDNDFTSAMVDEPLPRIVSPVAMESLRVASRLERAPSDMVRLNDTDLLEAIGVVREGRPTRAAVLLAGSPQSIRQHIPNFAWTHLRMVSPTDYSDRDDGRQAITVSLDRIVDLIMADNPIETVRQGLHHFEYRTYPEIALREALLNAFCHGDFRRGSPRLVKQYSDRIEISSPGGFVGGITPDNILHHQPVSRNPCLVAALMRLRLVNRSNLGMERIFSSLLTEGKPAPLIVDEGDSVRVTFRAAEVSVPMRTFVANEAARGVALAADHLLVLTHLLNETEIDAGFAARLCHRREPEARSLLVSMETEMGYLKRGGSQSERYWTLNLETRARLSSVASGKVDRETAKLRILEALRTRAVRGEPPPANADVREITLLDRRRVNRLMHELADEGHVRIEGHGRGARYVYTGPLQA